MLHIVLFCIDIHFYAYEKHRNTSAISLWRLQVADPVLNLIVGFMHDYYLEI
jgi:hypothetical protein